MLLMVRDRLNLQRVYETIEFSDLICIPKTQNGADVADCLRSSVSDTTRNSILPRKEECTMSVQKSNSDPMSFLRVVQPLRIVDG